MQKLLNSVQEANLNSNRATEQRVVAEMQVICEIIDPAFEKKQTAVSPKTIKNPDAQNG